MNEVLRYLLASSKPLLEETELAQLIKYEQHDWQQLINQLRGMIVTYPGMVRIIINFFMRHLYLLLDSYK